MPNYKVTKNIRHNGIPFEAGSILSLDEERDKESINQLTMNGAIVLISDPEVQRKIQETIKAEDKDKIGNRKEPGRMKCKFCKKETEVLIEEYYQGKNVISKRMTCSICQRVGIRTATSAEKELIAKGEIQLVK